MTGIQAIATLITLTALFSYVNLRFIKLPTVIGVMLISLALSLILIGLGHAHPALQQTAARWLRTIDFDDTLMQGMLSFLLFAGALSINLNDLAEEKAVVSVLAVGSVMISTVLFGTAMYFALPWFDLPLSYPWCLLFGALISPTDPIAVLGILKEAKAPRALEIQIAGESLFNDGIGVVAFLICSEIAAGRGGLSAGHIAVVFGKEALGGALFGLAVGYLTYRLLRSVDHYQVEILLTLGLVTGGYSLASALGLSGPIAIVVSGLLIGNHGRRFAMSATTRQHLDLFWELLDEMLNAVLFVLIGLEVLALAFRADLLLVGLVAIPILLFARWSSVALPVSVMRLWRPFTVGAVTIMTWGGLRGGISVALALSLPAGREREFIVATTYVLVVFSILVQGLTVGRAVRRFVKA